MTLLLALIALMILLILFSIVGVRVEIHKFEDSDNGKIKNPAPNSSSFLKMFGFGSNTPDMRRAKLMAEMNIYVKAPAAQKGVLAIAESEPGFDLLHFIQGARAAYGTIVGAFSKGDKAVLAPLLETELFEQFSSAIDQRGEPSQEPPLDLIEKTDIVQAGIKEKSAYITVRYVIDTRAAAKTDKSGGEPEAQSAAMLTHVADIWTFCRPLASPNPNWRLIETKDGGPA